MIPAQLSVPVSHPSQVGEARRAATRFSNHLADSTVAGRVAIVVTELATNIVRHGHAGEILLRCTGPLPDDAVEIVSLDKGPGMNVERCMADGFSTGGTMGGGLGAVSRLSSEFDIYSGPGLGTIVYSRVGAAGAAAAAVRVGVVSIPYPGEIVCGDNWQAASDGEKTSILVVDGLGHGIQAATAAQAALGAFSQSPFSSPQTILARAHDAMSSTRGGAAAVAQIHHASGELCFSGVGNIAGTIACDGTSRGLMSLNGTVGAQIRQIRELVYPWPRHAVLTLHSDGLATRWKLDQYPGLVQHHPAVLAAVLYRDFRRGNDDVTVVVLKAD